MADTVATVRLEPGTFVHTLDAGADFEIPMAKPSGGNKRHIIIREVKSVVGGVVRFTDGSKSAKLHGRTSWVLATEEEVMLS